MRPLLAALLLACAVPATAEPPNLYTYTRAVPDEPKSCRSPCSLTLSYTLPEPGIMLDPYLEDCRVWVNRGRPELWDGVPVAIDRYVGLVKRRPVLAQGLYRWELQDNYPDAREQRICARFEYVPLQRLYEAFEAYEEE